MNRPLLSIVVPVYKVERFLEKCVQSILSQTVADFELILVDDGSPDSCPEMCDRFAHHDSRIRVIHQQNKGLSGARNAGIDIATGTYIGFVDSDDYIAPDMYEKLLDAIRREEAQIAICNFQLVDEQGGHLDTTIDRLDPGTYTGMEILHKVAEPNATPYQVAWNKLYRRDIFRTLRYDLGKLNEDTRLFSPLFYGVERVVCIEDALYFYVSNSASIMRRKARLQNLDSAEAFYCCFAFCGEKGIDDLLAPLEKRVFAKLVGVYYQLSKEDRKSPRMPESLRMHREVLKTLKKKGQLQNAALARSLLFHLCPSLYKLRLEKQ